MANVLLNECCVRACPYCFAKKHMDDSGLSELSWENLIYIADFLEISNEKRVSLLGGEPTLHPNFVDFTTYLLERGFFVNVFTSGILSENKFKVMLQFLGNFSTEKLSFTCNLNNPEISTSDEIAKVDKFLSHFGHLTTPGYNIYKTNFDIKFLVDAINKYNLRRHIRIGLAHPIPGEVNKYVKIEDLKKMADKFMSFTDIFERFHITAGFDCGIPMCAFTEEELGVLFKINKGRLKFGCGPAIDIGPDMNVWSCFPLSNFDKKSLYDFNSLQEIGKYYQDVHNRIRTEVGGIYQDCDDCRYRKDELCMGGCIAHSIDAMKNESPIRLKEIHS